MTVGIMQPYFFPYLGYYQLVNAVDTFVILDDVNYIKRGYINSNYILVNNSPFKFTIPLDHPSQNKLIEETNLCQDISFKEKLLRTIELAYKKAPFYTDVIDLIYTSINYNSLNLTDYLLFSLKNTLNYLGIEKKIVLSSDIPKDNTLHGENRILAINKYFGSTHYINPIGGKELYSYSNFADAGIKLSFLRMNDIKYPQYNDTYIPNLSMIDVLMFNDISSIHDLLKQYTLDTN